MGLSTESDDFVRFNGDVFDDKEPSDLERLKRRNASDRDVFDGKEPSDLERLKRSNASDTPAEVRDDFERLGGSKAGCACGGFLKFSLMSSKLTLVVCRCVPDFTCGPHDSAFGNMGGFGRPKDLDELRGEGLNEGFTLVNDCDGERRRTERRSVLPNLEDEPIGSSWPEFKDNQLLRQPHPNTTT